MRRYASMAPSVRTPDVLAQDPGAGWCGAPSTRMLVERRFAIASRGLEMGRAGSIRGIFVAATIMLLVLSGCWPDDDSDDAGRAAAGKGAVPGAEPGTEPGLRQTAGVLIAMKGAAAGGLTGFDLDFSAPDGSEQTQGAACIRDDTTLVVACSSHFPNRAADNDLVLQP